MPAASASPENLLRHETSPYLLQHADNPVHWRPWGEPALAEARATGKPILLSVGYAACHWCHVMAHESFEDGDTAALMNRLYVNIKVDREERPDVDALYMNALHLMGEHGGWPLTMFLTPDGEPFWGGTYFPPAPRYGKPAFKDVLAGVADAWQTKPDAVRKNVAALVGALRQRAAGESGGAVGLEQIDRAALRLAQEVDPVHGGIGGAPKFPQPAIFELLWRGARRLDEPALRQAVTLTLDRMSQGGIYDHLGGGFARYSTDAQWLAPHFEKMLYDNAQLVELMTLVWQDTKSELLRRRVAETVAWVEREMTAEGDAFAATLDADSEGEEGKFYVWTAAEIDALLGAAAPAFKAAYDVKPEGNWEGRTILNRSQRMRPGDAAEEEGLARARAILFAARARRVPPGRDDKVLADWNGLMIAALARAGFAFGRPDWIARAGRALDGVERLLTGPDGRLRHSYRAGKLLHMGTLDDLAALAKGALALHEVTGEARHLAHARAWADQANRWFWDAEGGGYFFTASDAGDLIARTRSGHDNAVPSGAGTLAQAMARLYFHTGEAAWRDRAAATVAASAGEIARNVFPFATLLNAAELLERALQLVLVGRPGEAGFEALRRAVATSASLPNLVLQTVAPGADLPAGHPARGKGMIGGAATAYVCEGPVCSAPLTDAAELGQILASRR